VGVSTPVISLLGFDPEEVALPDLLARLAPT